MSENIGLVWNKATLIGRVVGNPSIQGGWASLQLRTQVPEPQEGGQWVVTDCMVPCLTNNARTIETLQKYVQADRQLIIEGYVKAWDGGFGVMITTVKLGSKTIFNADQQQGAGGGGYGGNSSPPNFPQG